jgi:glycosyltransferase involved in cell wall biosynthesis
MPTKQECAGVVFSEASSYGLPVLTFETGGISNYVENHVNGYCLPLGSISSDFVLRVQMLLDNPDQYLQMSINARDKYENELNWESWTSAVKDRIDGLN